MRPPSIKIEPGNFSQEPKARHEQMVEIFGLYYFWLRSAVHERMQHLINSPEARERLSKAFREPYELIASTFTDEQAKAATKLADDTVDEFAKLLLSMLSATGITHRLGSNHSIQFRLDMEVRDIEFNSIVMHETINRGGQKHFADYWGKWLLAHSK